jgi:hypothetical protein
MLSGAVKWKAYKEYRKSFACSQVDHIQSMETVMLCVANTVPIQGYDFLSAPMYPFVQRHLSTRVSLELWAIIMRLDKKL